MGNLATNLRDDRGHGPSGGREFGAGKVDPVAAGRIGGQASGLARRQAPQRQLERALEERILKSKSGWAHVRYLEILMARQAEAARAEASAERDRVKAELEALRAEYAELSDELDFDIAALERREAELEDRIEEREQRIAQLARAEDERLVELLRGAHERGMLEPALEALGMFERVQE